MFTVNTDTVLHRCCEWGLVTGEPAPHMFIANTDLVLHKYCEWDLGTGEPTPHMFTVNTDIVLHRCCEWDLGTGEPAHMFIVNTDNILHRFYEWDLVTSEPVVSGLWIILSKSNRIFNKEKVIFLWRYKVWCEPQLLRNKRKRVTAAAWTAAGLVIRILAQPSRPGLWHVNQLFRFCKVHSLKYISCAVSPGLWSPVCFKCIRAAIVLVLPLI